MYTGIGMAFSRNAKHPLRMFLYNRVTAATNHKSGYSTWASKGTPISGTTQIKDLFSSKHGNPKSTIALISRHFSDQAPVATEQMNLIKQLRERTSAPIKDVKTALVDCNWDIGNKVNLYFFLEKKNCHCFLPPVFSLLY